MAPRTNSGWVTVGRDQPEIGNLPIATATTTRTAAARATFFVTLMDHLSTLLFTPASRIACEGATPCNSTTYGDQICGTAWALERYINPGVCARMKWSNLFTL